MTWLVILEKYGCEAFLLKGTVAEWLPRYMAFFVTGKTWHTIPKQACKAGGRERAKVHKYKHLRSFPPFFFQKKLNFLWLFRVLGQEGGTLGGARVKRKGASVEDAQRHQRQEQCRRPPKKTRVEGRPPLFQTSSDMAGKQTVRKGTPIPQTS